MSFDRGLPVTVHRDPISAWRRNTGDATGCYSTHPDDVFFTGFAVAVWPGADVASVRRAARFAVPVKRTFVKPRHTAVERLFTPLSVWDFFGRQNPFEDVTCIAPVLSTSG